MSYFTDDKLDQIKKYARVDAMTTGSLWSFVHSTLMRLVEWQGGDYASHGDGMYKMKMFDVNTGAEFIQVALDERTAFLQEKASNDKSG